MTQIIINQPLQDFIVALDGFREGDFKKVISEAHTYLGGEILQREFKIPEPTLNRWISGDSLPPHAAQQVIVSTIQTLCSRLTI